MLGTAAVIVAVTVLQTWDFPKSTQHAPKMKPTHLNSILRMNSCFVLVLRHRVHGLPPITAYSAWYPHYILCACVCEREREGGGFIIITVLVHLSTRFGLMISSVVFLKD